jgi:hypothetical protein
LAGAGSRCRQNVEASNSFRASLQPGREAGFCFETARLVAGTRTDQNLRDPQTEVVAGGRNQLKLQTQKGRHFGTADLRDLASQFEMVAGARNHLKLLFRAAA